MKYGIDGNFDDRRAIVSAHGKVLLDRPLWSCSCKEWKTLSHRDNTPPLCVHITQLASEEFPEALTSFDDGAFWVYYRNPAWSAIDGGPRGFPVQVRYQRQRDGWARLSYQDVDFHFIRKDEWASRREVASLLLPYLLTFAESLSCDVHGLACARHLNLKAHTHRTPYLVHVAMHRGVLVKETGACADVDDDLVPQDD